MPYNYYLLCVDGKFAAPKSRTCIMCVCVCCAAINYSQWNMYYILTHTKSKLFEIPSKSIRLVFQNTFLLMNRQASDVTTYICLNRRIIIIIIYFIRCECVNEFTTIQCIFNVFAKRFHLLQFSRNFSFIM